MISRSLLTLLAAIALTLATSASTTANEQVVVVVGQGAPDLEHVAAQELMSQFKKLFDVRVVLTDFVPDKHRNLVLVGGPKKNKAVRQIAGSTWPELSDQGFILRSFDTEDRSGIIVAGNSPVATLWAVYELGHRFGIRYLLREDIFPDRQPLNLSGINDSMEPTFAVRSWKPDRDGVMSFESWSAELQGNLFQQLAKMKFNEIVLPLKPWQPMATYESQGIRKQTALIWRGEQFPILRDDPGRTAFGIETHFENSDFAGKQSVEDMTQAGIAHLQRIIAAAQRRGFRVTIEFDPLQFPAEFSGITTELQPDPHFRTLAVRPSRLAEPSNPNLSKLVEAQLRAYAETYPQIDSIHCAVSQSKDWHDEVGEIASQLRPAVLKGSVAVSLTNSTAKQARSSVLPHSTTRQVSTALDDVKHKGSIHRMSPASQYLPELDPTIHYMSRAAWSADATARSAHDDLFATITGAQAISDRLWLGFGHIESATDLLSQKDRDFSAPEPSMLLKHYVNQPAPDWWEALTEHYTQAMVELYRSRGPAHPRAQPLIYYYAKRSEYVLEYLACVKAVRAAAIAKGEGDTEAAIEQLEAAVESLYNAIDTLGDVAQDPSDRGLIAALNAYAYRPLMAEYERMLESE